MVIFHAVVSLYKLGISVTFARATFPILRYNAVTECLAVFPMGTTAILAEFVFAFSAPLAMAFAVIWSMVACSVRFLPQYLLVAALAASPNILNFHIVICYLVSVEVCSF
jgi:hypothetical protein